MAQKNNITIAFKGTGSEKLRNQIDKLAKAQAELNRKAGEDFPKAAGDGAKGGRLLNNTFATMRSKILLVNFAMAMGIKQLIDFTKQAAKIEAMEMAFGTLSGGSEKASIAMTKLKKATNGTMSEMDLFQQANNAMILGVSKNSDEMAEMFDIAQRLGRALGRDTKSSVESLITGIGRQSRLMLDNIGIIVKADEAYESYANELGTTADKLSDAEKKQAFLTATMESARQKVGLLNEEVLGLQDTYDKLGASTVNATTELGELISKTFAFSKTGSFISTAVSALGEWAKMMNGAIDGSQEMSENLKENTRDFIRLHKAMEFAGELEGGGFKEFFFGSDRFRKGIRKSREELGVFKSSTLDQNEQIGESFEITSEWVTESQFKVSEGFADQRHQLIFLNNIYKQTHEAKKQAIIDDIARLDLIAQEIGVTNELAIAMAHLQGLLVDFNKEKKKEVPILEDVTIATKFATSATMMLADELSRMVIEGENLEKLKLGKILGDIAIQMGVRGLVGGAIGLLVPGLGFAAGALGAMGVAHKGGHIKEDGSVQRFATGGMVKGQDNVPILAQAGEFVMQRSAVESVGLEAMNRINAGGGGGSVNISFAGNVMSQDFIEDEAIPMIKEAIRRGADIGVA